jgi:hypothetical protein
MTKADQAVAWYKMRPGRKLRKGAERFGAVRVQEGKFVIYVFSDKSVLGVKGRGRGFHYTVGRRELQYDYSLT